MDTKTIHNVYKIVFKYLNKHGHLFIATDFVLAEDPIIAIRKHTLACETKDEEIKNIVDVTTHLENIII